jgi:hypothetical protein
MLSDTVAANPLTVLTMDAISEGDTIPPYNVSLVGSLAPSIAVLQHRQEFTIVDDIASKVQVFSSRIA